MLRKVLGALTAGALCMSLVAQAADRPAFKEGEMLCKGAVSRSSFAAAGAYVKDTLRFNPDVSIVAVPKGSERALAERFGCEVNQLYYPTETVVAFAGQTGRSNDPWWSYQSTRDSANNKVANFTDTQVDQAWSITTGSGATVAVIDTGYASGVSDGAINVLPGRDFANNDYDPEDKNGHGTHVAHTIAEATNNGEGAAGIAYNANILPVKVFPDSGGGASCSDIADGIVWAAQQGANVANLSLGGPQPGCSVVQDALRQAQSLGMLAVCAAGNDGQGSISSPAAFPECIAVTALDTNNDPDRNATLASFSNWGNEAEITAPGVSILQTTCMDYQGQWTCGGFFLSGTSMASPHVAGIAGLLFSNAASGSVSADSVRAALTGSAKDLGSSGWDSKFGYGLVQAYDALTY